MFPLALPSDLYIAKAPDATVTFKAICDRYIPEAIGQTEQAASHFRKASDLPRDLWSWCRENFDYKLDRAGYEQIRLPRQSWADRKTGIDCEDFVILLSGILHNLRITHTVRMTDYGSGWQHIYLKIGKVTLDPVNTRFNQEPAYTRKKDHTFYLANATLNGLTGVEESKKWMFVDEMRRRLAEGQTPTRRQMESLAADTYGIKKEIAKEVIELANFRHSAYLVSQSKSTQEAFDSLVEAYNVQANSSLRTSDSIIFQQYSTPLPMAFLAGAFCGLSSPSFEVRAFEPTAGNGFLMVATGAGKRTGSVLNELSPERYSNLLKLAEDFNFKVTNRDASEPEFYNQPRQFEAVIANPPFGEIPRRAFDKILVNKLDQWIVLHTLTQMKDDGRGAFIIGGHTSYDKEGRITSRNQTTGDRYFYNYLYHHYNVTDTINLNGELYSRQGTGFDVRMILIAGRKSTPGGYAPLFKDANTTVEYSWTDLWKRFQPHLFSQTPEIPENETLYSPVKVTIRHNKTQNGIEIKFQERPPDSAVSWLKSNGYRWARAGHWYVTYSESRWKAIQEKYGEGAPAPQAASVSTPAPVDALTDEQKAHRRFNAYVGGRPGQADYYGLDWNAFTEKVNRLKPKGFQVKGIFIELVYDKDGKTFGGTHLPPKRKRPDEYFLVNIQDMLNKEYMAAGGIISFADLSSNSNNRDRFRYDSDLNYFVKTYPRQIQAPDYAEFAKKAAENTRIKEAEIDKWNAYRKNHFKVGQILYTPKRGAVLFNPVPKEQNFVQAKIESLTSNSFFYSRYDTIQVVIGHGYVMEVGERLLKDLYLESPDSNPDAKNLLELYPPDGEKPGESAAVEAVDAALATDENGEAQAKEKRLRLMRMKAKAIQIRLKLIAVLR